MLLLLVKVLTGMARHTLLSGEYIYETLGSNGCDSTATLNLTINPSTTSTANVTACDTYIGMARLTSILAYTFLKQLELPVVIARLL